MPVPDDEAELLTLAEDTARSAGDLVAAMLSRAPAQVTSTKSSRSDVVTTADRAAERLIRDRLTAARPGDGFVGEEGGWRPGSSGVVWVVDPIDGTVNYLYGIPAYAVSIAATRADASTLGTGRTPGPKPNAPGVVAGVVHNPSSGETWTARRGNGAHLNGRRVQVSGCTDLAQALVATGFGYESSRRAGQAEVLRRVLPAVRDIRRIGAAALDLCAVATGRVDAYYERGLQPWDLAAGRLVASEAGAVVAGLHGAAPSGDLVLASGPALFPALHDLLAGLGADRDGDPDS